VRAIASPAAQRGAHDRALSDLRGKAAIVTGAARGLGRAYALRLARLGADIAVIDRDLDGAAAFGEALSAPSVAEEIQGIGRRAIGIEADLGRSGTGAGMAARVLELFGRIDILVNNAGGLLTPVERSRASVIEDADIQAIFDANLTSAIQCCRAVVPAMRAQGSGVIVNMASTAGISTAVGGLMAHYAAAKAAVVHYTRHLAAELGPDGIRVNCIAPGIVMTARVAAQAQARGVGTAADLAAIPLGRFGTTEDCAGVLEFLTSDLSAYVTGQCISVCGGRVLTPS
jgi:NAD(P)-dependent dehydrogenase (short-subunit alcohol dehydrogenase family)